MEEKDASVILALEGENPSGYVRQSRNRLTVNRRGILYKVGAAIAPVNRNVQYR